MISGRQALADMERAISGTRSDEGRLDGVLASATAEAQRLRQSQTEAYRSLARFRLDAIASEAVGARLEATERRALQLMEAARATMADLAAKRDAAAAELERVEREYEAASAATDRIDDDIDELTAAVAAAGGADPDWQAARTRVDEAERVAAESEKKADVAEADRRTKGAPYEADPLFMYLWNRRFGTAEYRAGNLVRYLDRKVAALVGYADARPNYAMLVEIPIRLREHAARRHQDVETARAAQAALERAKLEAAGIAAVEARRVEAQTVQDRSAAALKQARDHLAAIEQQIALAREGGDKGGCAEALDLIAGEMSREDLKALYRAAAATPDPRDDRLVRQIADLDAAIAKVDGEIAAIRAEAREIARRRSELESVRDDFRRQGYDQPQVVFGNDRLIGEMIGGIIGGVLRSPDLWRVLRDGYGTKPRRADPRYGGGPRFPMPGPGGFGGGSGPGGGGGGGGDGFRTGGGF